MNRFGSIFVAVVVFLAIMFAAVFFLLSSSVDHSRHVETSLRGLQTVHLAESAMQTALNKLRKEIDGGDLTDPQSLATLLRYPAKPGSDGELELIEALRNKVIIYTREELGKKRFDGLVEFLASGSTDLEYNVTVTIRPGKFRYYRHFNSPVPGINLEPYMRGLVRQFLENQRFPTFVIDLSEPLGIFVPDLTDMFGDVDYDLSGMEGGLEEIAVSMIDGTIKVVSDFVFEGLFGDMSKNSIIDFPNPFDFNQVKRFSSFDEVWPASLNFVPSFEEEMHLEKYGELIFVSEATLSYGGVTTNRRIEGIREVRVLDYQPPAPMYSLFVADLGNDPAPLLLPYNPFVTLGPNITVNNQGPLNILPDLFNSQDIPALIRVNWLPSSDLSYLGIPVPPADIFLILELLINPEGSVLQGSDLMGVPLEDWGDVAQGDGSLEAALGEGVWEWGKGNFGINLIPPLLYDFTFGSGGDIGHAGPEKISVCQIGGYLEWLRLASRLTDPAMLMGGPTDHYPAAEDILGQPRMYLPLPALPIFQTNFSVSKLQAFDSLMPIIGMGASLFGHAAMQPTMTKEIEGKILKVYQRNFFAIGGLLEQHKTLSMLLALINPALEQVVIPYIFLHPIRNKYAPNLVFHKPLADEGGFKNRAEAFDPAEPANFVPNLRSIEEYLEKANYFYASQDEFLKDIGRRTVAIDDKKVFMLNGITFIDGDLGTAESPFSGHDNAGEFFVSGRGMIVISGNCYLNSNIRLKDENTVFSLIVRAGSLSFSPLSMRVIEGSYYTHSGVSAFGAMVVVNGNWIVGELPGGVTEGVLVDSFGFVVNFTSSRLRGRINSDSDPQKVEHAAKRSMATLHPVWGKFVPDRYVAVLAPKWHAWAVKR